MLGDIYMNDLRDFNTAIQEYRKVIKNYSGSDQEPHALFMIGYVYANILNDTKSAKIEYEEFFFTESWLNISGKCGYQKVHNHSNSIIIISTGFVKMK